MYTLEDFFGKLAQHILEHKGLTPAGEQNAIKQYTDKLLIHGDFGFPTTFQAWQHFVESLNDFEATDKIIQKDDVQIIEELRKISFDCGFPIKNVEFLPFRCLLFLDREKCFGRVIKMVVQEDPSYGQWFRSEGGNRYHIEAQKYEDDNLTEFRGAIIAKVLINLLHTSGFETVQNIEKDENADNLVNVQVAYSGQKDGIKSTDRQNEIQNNNNFGTRSVICGAVRCRRSKTADEFIQLRANEMAKMAELKYGTDEENMLPYDYNKLGAAIVTFDLLKAKHINIVDLDSLCDQKSTPKGSAFILYNVARLQKLLSTFEHQAATGFYNRLPAVEHIDFGLLKEEEEWQMLYVYVIGFPSMLERCVGGIDNGQISIHLLCIFLNNLAALFSVYYHRVKILTDNLPQLCPVMFARIHLLEAIRTIFLKSLSILEIEPLNEM